jgi:hypothetical protein
LLHMVHTVRRSPKSTHDKEHDEPKVY